MKQIKDILTDIRSEKGMTPTQVANELGIERYNYYHYEKGKCYPPIDVLIKLSKLYNVLVDDLVGADNWFNPNEEMPKGGDKKCPLRVWVYGGAKFKFNCEASYIDGKFYIDGQDVTKHVKKWRPIFRTPS